MTGIKTDAAVELVNVVKSYGAKARSVRALDDVSLVVPSGEFLSIMGPSGSGKSTLLHLIGALDRPDSGEVLLDGRPLSSLSDNELSDSRRLRIGFVFQRFNLLPTLTALENASLPLMLGGQRDMHAEKRVRDLMVSLELGDRLDHKPDELSGGELQRIAIARALAMNPSVVLADEPTGNLDTHTGEEILTLLKRQQSELGQTLVLVTHDPRAAAYGDRIMTLRDGRLLEEVGVMGAAS